ncbi:MAG: DegT/DnrJ/EryC1/StrS family aminotransferase, partial [Lachnospiraceae bacterium]|nr:DegT/DnrJ/EryC1/StrS family aminotransferase [Lachnospiraceae bacterium]
MTDIGAKIIRMQPRFKDIFENGGKPSEADQLPVCRIYGDERELLEEALSSCLDGGQTEKLGKELAEFTGVKYAIPMNSATAAIHIALKLAAERIYGSASGLSTPDGAGTGGALTGKRVFCSDFAPSASANAIVYEGGIPVFIDCGEEDWSMDPEVLERAFER